MDYQKILDQLVKGELKEYKVDPQNAFDFQEALRNYGKRQNIMGRTERGGAIVYQGTNGDD